MISFVLTGEIVLAATNKQEVVDNCALAILENNTGEKIRFASEVIGFTSVYTTDVQQKGSSCLSSVYGGDWAYNAQEGIYFTFDEEVFYKATSVLELKRKQKIEQKYENILRDREQRKILYEAEAKAKEEQREKEAKLLAGRHEVVKKALEGCAELYKRDYVAAITNRFCYDIFYKVGHLPE